MSDSNTMTTVPPAPKVHELIAKVGDRSLTFDARLSSVGAVMKATAHKMMAALPKHVTPDRMMRVAINCIRKVPKLLDCDPASLFGAITEAATYGWELGGVLGHAYLVPFGRECTLIPGYKGLVDLCRRSGQISTISAEVVHQGDKFDYSLGDDPHIRHVPNDGDPQRHSKPISYVYVVVKLRDGGIQRSVWSAASIDAHKEKYSQAWRNADRGKKDSSWHTAWPAMAKKTVLRDMIGRGLLPVSAEYREIVDRGIKHDDDGGMDLGTFDFIPETADAELPAIDGEVSGQDTADRPDTGDSPDTEIMFGLDVDLKQATTISACEDAKVKWLKLAKTDEDRTVIVGKMEVRAEELRAAKKAQK